MLHELWHKLVWRPLLIIYKHVKREAVGTGPIGPAISALSFVYRHTGTSLSRFEWILVCYWMLICGTMVDLTSRLCRSGPCLFHIFVELRNSVYSIGNAYGSLAGFVDSDGGSYASMD